MHNTANATIEFSHDAILGEGPVWDEQEGRLYWVDILSGKLFQYDPYQKRNKAFDMGEHLGCVALREEGGLVIARQSGFVFFDPKQRKVTSITESKFQSPDSRFNDGKCDPSGRFWAGTLSYDLEEGAGSLYCLDQNLDAQVKLRELTIPNGMAWNRKGDKFFFIDTPTRKVQAFDYDNASGEISNLVLVKRLDEEEGFPDGMTIDREGALWIALYDGGKVIRIDPDSGEILFEVHLPVPQVTSCTFGGADFSELYITTGREHMSEKDINQWPLSGSLFKVELPFKGWPANRFAG
jgi:sugar lactone lactonase YvrE